MNNNDICYQTGFGNEFATESIPGSLPVGKNSPQKVPHGLYAETLSGTAFTMPTKDNQRTWFYRILPSATHKPFKHIPEDGWTSSGTQVPESAPTPNQLRWNPLSYPEKPTPFYKSLKTVCTNGSVAGHSGCGVHLYTATASMTTEYLYNSDGDLLIVPEQGELRLKTECGLLDIAPLEIAVIPRGMAFQVELKSEKARGYVCENYGAHFVLPDKGPIGSNGLAAPRDFEHPVAWYEEKTGDFQLINKFQGRLWSAPIDHSPLNVVAWHGNYAPYKYHLSRFQVVNSVSFDHSDPSIFTVLTSPSPVRGTANIDFVIFPPRWIVSEDTFRPPWYHRNVMSEYMGLIEGVYDAKKGGDGGFVPGGGSLHNCMSAHGPDASTFEAASNAELKPVYQGNTMAFMFESCLTFAPTDFALSGGLLQTDYFECWQGLKPKFGS